MDKEKLTAALDKKAVYGNDIDLNAYNDTNEARTKSVGELSQATRDRLEYVGIETGAAEEENRSASFVQLDNNAVEVKVKKQTPLELMSTGKAAEKYPELVEKYWWKAVKPDTDKYTAKGTGTGLFYPRARWAENYHAFAGLHVHQPRPAVTACA